MHSILANSGPSGLVESLIAGPAMIVAIIFGLSGIIFRYRPAALAGGVVSLFVAAFWVFCSVRYDTRGAVAAILCSLVGVALIVFKRAPKR